jgi:sulfur-oxidizing protein SoxZ
VALARIQVPREAKRGEVIEVRIVIQHPMETGFRRDQAGARIPRNAIHSLVCRYNGAEVFRATLSAGIAANPYLRFFTRATASGDLEFQWIDDDEVRDSARARLVVTA